MDENRVTLIDSNQKTIQNIDETLDVLSICGDVEDPYTYRNIKDDIELFIAVTDSDEVNLLSSLIIDNIVQVKEKIVRLKNDFFMSEKIKKKLGITDIITPFINVANTFNYLVDFPYANNIKTFDCTKSLLLCVRAHEDLKPVFLKSLKDEFSDKIIVAGIERGDKFFMPKETTMVMPGDLMYIFTFTSQVKNIGSKICYEPDKQEIKNCIVYGTNQLGIEISEVLVKKGLNVKLIDKNMEGCKRANAILKNSVEVVKSNYNLDFILETHAQNTNIFIAATINDEFNITKCLEAKQKGIKKVIGIHNNRQYASLMRKLGIEVIRGEKMSAYYEILEKISSSIVSKKAFCGGEGIVYVRKIFPQMVGKKLEIRSNIYNKGSFFVQREKKFFNYSSIDEFKIEDIIVCFSLFEDSKLITSWFKQNLDE